MKSILSSTEMIGYVTYTTSSALYPRGDVLAWVRANYDVYAPYAGYVMKGPRDAELNRVMHLLFDVRHEYDTTGKYVVPIDTNSHAIPPDGYMVPVMRRMYILDENLRQVRMVGTKMERYMVGLDIPIYVGKRGAFLLVDDPSMATQITRALSIS